MFFEIIETDSTITPHHISLYLILFNAWNKNYFENPLIINRVELMRLAKIGSTHTYRNCLKELHQNGYIIYQPKDNKRKKNSSFCIIPFDKDMETWGINAPSDSGKSAPQTVQICPTNGAEVRQYIRTNKTKTTIYPHGAKMPHVDNKKNDLLKSDLSLPPHLDEAIQFFMEEQSTEELAKKFFNYYQSTGWKIGGHAKIQDWQAAARNYIINAATFQKNTNYKPTPDNLHVNQDKDYSEPL